MHIIFAFPFQSFCKQKSHANLEGNSELRTPARAGARPTVSSAGSVVPPVQVPVLVALANGSRSHHCRHRTVDRQRQQPGRSVGVRYKQGTQVHCEAFGFQCFVFALAFS
jgi:hypothetical protein